MLAGKIEPPGCWLDASAMLVRQYLAFCLDSAVKEQVIDRLPASGKQLADDMELGGGPIITLLDWMTAHEAALQERFLSRFALEVRDDTRNCFSVDAQAERLRQHICRAAGAFGAQLKALENTRERLNEQKKGLADQNDQTGLREVEREMRILASRRLSLARTSALEILTDHGLLPNYAFPERGVRLSGVVYNEHRGDGEEQDVLTIELTRAGAVAIRELAPRNYFYTRGHQFEIQQLSLGSQAQTVVEDWAVCGKCGHMRLVHEVDRPDAKPACPQCGYGQDAESQFDRAQRKRFVEFAQSSAISYMEYYDSLSGDRADERQRRGYRLVYSFDHSGDGVSGAVGAEDEPFGLEFRATMVLRQVNTGFAETPATFPFGVDQRAAEQGFTICADCGVAADVDGNLNAATVSHRRSCSGRRRTERNQRQGHTNSAYNPEKIYVYRELKSEAIRLLLPDVDGADIATLRACLFLGLRLHFKGDPGHLLIEPQVLPDHKRGIRRNYLVLMDAVPGGTGFLKSLFEPKDQQELPGEGIMHVLRLARDALRIVQLPRLAPGG